MAEPLAIYTFGYTGFPQKLVFDWLRENNGVLCDIRFKPWSRAPIWRSPHLQKALGDRYVWIRDLGNIQYFSGNPYEIVDLERGMSQVMKIAGSDRVPLLMCTCPPVNDCHRGYVMGHLWERFCITPMQLVARKTDVVEVPIVSRVLRECMEKGVGHGS
jgi:uncharacterized protein (DUF488 family)